MSREFTCLLLRAPAAACRIVRVASVRDASAAATMMPNPQQVSTERSARGGVPGEGYQGRGVGDDGRGGRAGARARSAGGATRGGAKGRGARGQLPG